MKNYFSGKTLKRNRQTRALRAHTYAGARRGNFFLPIARSTAVESGSSARCPQIRLGVGEARHRKGLLETDGLPHPL